MCKMQFIPTVRHLSFADYADDQHGDGQENEHTADTLRNGQVIGIIVQ